MRFIVPHIFYCVCPGATGSMVLTAPETYTSGTVALKALAGGAPSMGRKRFELKVAHRTFDNFISLHRRQATAGLLLRQKRRRHTRRWRIPDVFIRVRDAPIDAVGSCAPPYAPQSNTTVCKSERR